MTLMPIDIHNKEFGKSFRGYNEEAVDQFLDQIIKEFELMIKERKQLKEKLEQTEHRLAHYTKIDETLTKSLVLAQSTSDRLRTDAEKEAERVRIEAEKEANRIVNAAWEKSREIEKEMASLKNRANVFRNRFKLLIGSQLAMLENNDWDELLEKDKPEE